MSAYSLANHEGSDPKTHIMRVALVIWTNPDYYQVVIHTSQILSEDGHQVDVLCRATGETFMGNVDYASSTRVFRYGKKRKGFRNYIDFLRYLAFTARMSIKFKYDLIIGYDMFGLIAAFLMTRFRRKKAFLVYHNFDLADKRALGFFGRQLKRIERVASRKANLVIFPTEDRARIFQGEVKLAREPMIVMNSQRISPAFKRTEELRRISNERGIKASKFVIRLGSIAPGHAIEATIRSVKYWQEDWALVLLGVPLGDYMPSMQRLVGELGLTQKVLFIPNATYEMWDACLQGADVGLSLYEPINVNHQALGGIGGQKTFYYMKAGIPSVVPALPDFLKMVDKYKFGVVADPSDPVSIARSINDVLSDDAQYNFLARAARHAFVKEFNFENQFAPVLKLITDSLGH